MNILIEIFSLIVYNYRKLNSVGNSTDQIYRKVLTEYSQRGQYINGINDLIIV